MKLSDWMSGIRDDVKLIDVVMPGSHNSGTRGMMAMACCQDGSLAEQFRYGVRQFSVRLDTNRITKKIVFSHSCIRGVTLEEELSELKKVMDENPSEFSIIDIRPYGNDSIGPFKFRCYADTQEIDRLLEKYLEPSKYALTDFEKISDVTMGDIRKAGKRYLLLNEEREYKYSVCCDYKNPWSSERHGRRAETFAERATEVYDSEEKKGIFVLQTQQTAGPGTEVGLDSPRRQVKKMIPFYPRIIEKIRKNPKYLEMANVISSDFMSGDDFRAKLIISLNIDKHNVKEEMAEEFAELVK